MKEGEVVHWDAQWANRTKTGKVEMNIGKLRVLLDELWKRPYLFRREKLDIGCGTGVHAYILSQYAPEAWNNHYTGIDLSQTAIDHARQVFGLNVVCGNIFDYESSKFFDVFLLLDSLEHFPDHNSLAEKIVQLGGRRHYTILGNVPLYLSGDDENIERPISLEDVRRFAAQAGCSPNIQYMEYGVNGYPYMLFEATSSGEIEPYRADESIAAIPKVAFKDLTTKERN